MTARDQLALLKRDGRSLVRVIVLTGLLLQLLLLIFNRSFINANFRYLINKKKKKTKEIFPFDFLFYGNSNNYFKASPYSVAFIAIGISHFVCRLTG